MIWASALDVSTARQSPPPPCPPPPQHWPSLWCRVMASTRKLQKVAMETAEKRTPTKKKPRSPLSQVLQ